MYITHTLTMDLSGPAVTPKVDMVQRDQYVRKLRLELYSDGAPWAVPEHATAIICYQKTDGTGGEYDTLPDGRRAWVSEENVLTVDIAPQVLTHPGPVNMAVDLLSGDAKLSTFLILLYVQKAIPLGLPSGDYFKLEGFLPIPKSGSEGQLLRISGVSEAGLVTGVEGYDLYEALEEAKDSGLFDGKSAYQVALDNGFVGTEEEWLESLKGKGISAALGNIAQINITGQLTTDYNVTVDVNSSRIQRVKSPVEASDAANKAYVDQAVAGLGEREVPAYWQEALEEAKNRVRTVQDLGGMAAVSFVWFSDMHYQADRAASLGALVSKIMDSCHIPIAVFSGDALDAGILTEAAWRDGLYAADKVFSQIGTHRVLQAQGVHDGSRGEGNIVSIQERLVYGSIFRKQTGYHRVFGSGGSYCYTDLPEAKLRLIVLNPCCHQSGTSVFGFGNDQINWLASTALTFPEQGWTAVLVSHISPEDSRIRDGDVLRNVLMAFDSGALCSVTGGTEGEEDFVSVHCDFSAKPAGEILGAFCGECHSDTLTDSAVACRVVTIQPAVNLDETTAATAEEYAIDIVTVNRNSRVVNLTRLGYGESRSFLY